jgi:hypothetical protein
VPDHLNWLLRWGGISGWIGGADGLRLAAVLELLSPLQIHQPRLAPADPEFIVRYDVAGRKIESAEHHLRLVIPQGGDARSAIGAKASSFKRPEFAGSLIGRSRPNSKEGESTAAHASAILAMAQANAQLIAFDREANRATKATAVKRLPKLTTDWSAPLGVDRSYRGIDHGCRVFEERTITRHRSYSITFKLVVQEYLSGETLHSLAKRHDITHTLIRVWIGKHEAGGFDEDTASVALITEYEARIAA